MNEGKEPVRIIGNESNQIIEIEPGSSAPAPKETATQEEQPIKPSSWEDKPTAVSTPSNDLATNDGSVIGTLDAAFHNKSGVAEDKNLAGSNRADNYENNSSGKSDAEEEVSTSSSK